MRYRLALNQEATDSVVNGVKTLFALPRLRAQAAEEGQRAQAEMDLRAAQQRQADAHAALFGAQTDAARQLQDYRTEPALLKSAMLQQGVPLSQIGEAADYLQSGRLAQKYDMPPGLQGPTMPAPEYSTRENANQIFRILGLTRGALGTDGNVEQIAGAAGKMQQQDAVRDVMADPTSAGRVGQAFAAAAGKPLIENVGNTGRSFNQFTGQGGTIDAGMATLFDQGEQAGIRKDTAAATASNASAGAARALGEQRRAVTAAGPGQGKPPSGYRFVMGEDGEAILAPIPGGPRDPGAMPAKPMPSAAVKLQQEELDAIGTASSIDADLGALVKQIDGKKLMLGVISNLWNKARNGVGLSSEESRNLASFQATLERMRNDSLRLNKGVQTEGDAIRAWNELVASINDPQLVKQRLGEIRRLNARAAELRRLNIDVLRNNFGQPPLDTSRQFNVPAAVGSGKAPAATSSGGAPASPSGSTVSNW